MRRWAVNPGAMLTQWKMAHQHGTPYRDLLQQTLSASWERFWQCRVLGHHQEKFSSPGACYKCGRPLR
jgi:rubrerythrin